MKIGDLKFGNIRFISILLVLGLLAGAIVGCHGKATVQPPATTTPPSNPPAPMPPATATQTVETIELNVSAAASLTDALKEVNNLYKQSHSNVAITANFASSGTLQKQIENGAPVDIFISAGAVQMDNLERQQLLLNGTRKDILNNKVVLIVPVDSTLGITSFNDLTNEKVTKVAIGDPKSVPAGIYAQEAIDNLGITARVQSKLVYGADVRQVLTYVESSNVDAGMVYLTDALTSSKVKIAASATKEINSKIVYPVAVIKAASNPDTAIDYENFLFGDQAKAIFEKYGFTLVSK